MLRRALCERIRIGEMRRLRLSPLVHHRHMLNRGACLDLRLLRHQLGDVLSVRTLYAGWTEMSIGRHLIVSRTVRGPGHAV